MAETPPNVNHPVEHRRRDRLLSGPHGACHPQKPYAVMILRGNTLRRRGA